MPTDSPSLTVAHSSSPSSLSQMSASSPIKQSFSCSECGKSFTSQLGLKYHRDRHFGKYPYTCPYCQKGIHATINLKAHIRKEHGGTGIGFSCIYCGADCVSVNHLSDHLEGCARKPSHVPSAIRNPVHLEQAEDFTPVGRNDSLKPKSPEVENPSEGQIYITVMQDNDTDITDKAQTHKETAFNEDSQDSMGSLNPSMFAISNVCRGIIAGATVGGTGEMIESKDSNEDENTQDTTDGDQ